MENEKMTGEQAACGMLGLCLGMLISGCGYSKEQILALVDKTCDELADPKMTKPVQRAMEEVLDRLDSKEN